MIITNTIEVKINKSNIENYKNYFPDIEVGDILEVPVSMISPGSNRLILAKCDMCDSEKQISYKLYNKSIKSGGLFACSRKCSSEKLKNRLISEYGVANISQLPEVKIKIKSTNIERYGNENFFSSEIGKAKVKYKIIEKYGTDNPQKNEEIKNKTRSTNKKKYGTDCVLKSKEVRESIENTNLERYGYKQASKSDKVKNKIKSTNQSKYGGNSPMCDVSIREKSKNKLMLNHGVDSPLKSNEIKKRVKDTNLSNIGVEYPTQSEMIREKVRESFKLRYDGHTSLNEEFRKANYKIANDSNYISYISGGNSIFKCDYNLEHDFIINTDNYFRRKYQGLKLCTVCNPIGSAVSMKEKEVIEFIKLIYDGEIIESHRDILEIDIYLPEIKLGFEFNGLYWHSSENKKSDYHINKSLYFRSKEIRIVHIWEDDWTHKQEIVKSMIRNLIGLSNKKISARDCTVVEIKNTKDYKEFLNENHIQGYVRSKIQIGLIYNNKIVSIMSFDQFEGRKKMPEEEWNLSRFCTKLDTNVVGGASKLLSYFIKNYRPDRIISYADRDWSEGKLYYNLNFELISESSPDYKYLINGRRVHKSRFRKSKTNISESKIEIPRVYDCGKLKFELKLKTP